MYNHFYFDVLGAVNSLKGQVVNLTYFFK